MCVQGVVVFIWDESRVESGKKGRVKFGGVCSMKEIRRGTLFCLLSHNPIIAKEEASVTMELWKLLRKWVY